MRKPDRVRRVGHLNRKGRSMTLYTAVELAARDLPINWTIEIVIEQGSASVYLYDPSHNDACLDAGDPSDNLAEQVMTAISIARRQA